MSGSKMKDDPAEISVSGTLYRIEAEISKGDYGVMMAILTENFGEKGAFKTMKAAGTGQANDRSALTLPVKTKYNGSRSSLASTSSLLEAMKSQERDPEVKAVEFSFKLRGLQVTHVLTLFMNSMTWLVRPLFRGKFCHFPSMVEAGFESTT